MQTKSLLPGSNLFHGHNEANRRFLATRERLPDDQAIFVIRNLGQDRRFDLADCFSFLFFLHCVNRLTGGVNQPCRHKNDEIAA